MKLKLHEAIEIVLKEMANKTATIHGIADEINQRNLYQKKNGSPVLKSQIRLRTHPNTKSGNFYQYLFEYIEPDRVRLRI